MSMILMATAMKMKVGSPLRKLVLLELCYSASDSGQCISSYEDIAGRCEISRKSVISHIADLVEEGLVIKRHRKKEVNGSERNMSNVYQINLDAHVSRSTARNK